MSCKVINNSPFLVVFIKYTFIPSMFPGLRILSRMVIVGDAQHDVPKCDLVFMLDRAFSARLCPVRLMRSAKCRKLTDLFVLVMYL